MQLARQFHSFAFLLAGWSVAQALNSRTHALQDLGARATVEGVTLSDVIPAQQLSRLSKQPHHQTTHLVGPDAAQWFRITGKANDTALQKRHDPTTGDIILTDKTCPAPDWLDSMNNTMLGVMELVQYSIDMLDHPKKLTRHPIWRKLIEKELADKPGTHKLYQRRLRRLLARLQRPKTPIKLRCDQRKTAPQCIDTSSDAETLSWADWGEGEINVCDGFAKQMHMGDLGCNLDLHVSFFDSMSASIIHEAIHVEFQEDPEIWVRDVKYGWTDCVALAQHKFDKIAPGASIINVDTFTLMINSFYWYDQCKLSEVPVAIANVAPGTGPIWGPPGASGDIHNVP